MDYIIHLGILICLYTILAQSLSIVAGYSGQISFAQAGFYGIGAYVSSLLSINFNFPISITLPLSMMIAGLIAYLVARIAVKTIDDYYIIITLGIQVILYSIFNNWQMVTNGPLGISKIPNVTMLNFEFNSKVSYFILVILISGIVWFALNRMTQSPFGRVLIALSEDEIYTMSLGKNVRLYKISSLVISGTLASVAGVFYAHYITYIDPSSFKVEESIFILSIIIIGGMRNLKGIFIATVFLILMPEILRFIGMPSSTASNVRQILYGIALIVVILVKNGIFSKRKIIFSK